MEQRKEQSQQQNPPTLMRCPRCSSLDTKFDYFNNHSLAQPRHHCRTCKRRWTVGGKLRSIPVGGSSRSISKQVKASSSRSSSLGAQSMFTIEEECLQYAQALPPTEARVHQDFDAAMTQPVTDLPEVSELPCPNSEVINQHVAYGSHSNSDGGNMGILEEWNIPDPPQQLLPEHTPIHNSPYQPHNQASTVPHYDLYYTSLVQPGQPENSSSQKVPNDFSSFTSDPSLRNCFIGSLTNPEDDTFFVNIDDWLNNPDEDTSSVNIDEWLNDPEEDTSSVNVDEWLNDPEEDISSVNVDEWLNLSDHSTLVHHEEQM